MAGRLHLYEGRSPAEVVHAVRTALGHRLPDRRAHLQRRRRSTRPTEPAKSVAVSRPSQSDRALAPDRHPGRPPGGSPYVDLTDAWSPGSGPLARQVEPALAEGVYAQVPGPQLETPAEVRMLAGWAPTWSGCRWSPRPSPPAIWGPRSWAWPWSPTQPPGWARRDRRRQPARHRGAGQRRRSPGGGGPRTATAAAGDGGPARSGASVAGRRRRCARRLSPRSGSARAGRRPACGPCACRTSPRRRPVRTACRRRPGRRCRRGGSWVPRWRTMIEPAVTAVPSNAFTPERCALESRPLRVEPPPLVFDMRVLLDLSQRRRRDGGDLHRGVALPVAPTAALVRLGL